MLSLTVQNLRDVAVFHCDGSMTVGSRAALRDAVREHNAAHTFVLDMAGLSRLDAAGLGALVDLRNCLRTAGRKLKLMNLTPRVERLLQLTGLSSQLEVCSMREMMHLICLAFAGVRGQAAVAAPAISACSPEAA